MTDDEALDLYDDIPGACRSRSRMYDEDDRRAIVQIVRVIVAAPTADEAAEIARRDGWGDPVECVTVIRDRATERGIQ